MMPPFPQKGIVFQKDGEKIKSMLQVRKAHYTALKFQLKNTL